MPHARQHVTHNRALGAAVVLLLILTFLPARYGYWANEFQRARSVVIGPSEWVLGSLAGLLVRPARSVDDQQRRALEMDRDHWRSMYEAVRLRLREYEQRLARYETGASAPDSGIAARRAQVTGPAGAPGTQKLRIRAGTRDGLARGTVAVTDRVQVVGRVEGVRGGESTLVLITQEKQPPIQGALLTDERPDAPDDAVVRCQLHPFGDGTLRGMVEYKTAEPGRPQPEPKVGQTVFLDDPSWPENSRMLVLGRVEQTREALELPLRRIIVVRPTVQLDRLTEVTLRIPQERAEAPGGGP